jgi:hypothetical protein
METGEYANLRCFHSLPLTSIRYGEMEADPEHTRFYWFNECRWLSKLIGFHPLFLAFGHEDAINNTFYEGRAEPPSRWGMHPVLAVFPFDALVTPVFTDYTCWPEGTHDELFRPEETRNDWFRLANVCPVSVQLLVPRLDFRKASELWVTNLEHQKELQRMGFQKVLIKRLEPIKE